MGHILNARRMGVGGAGMKANGQKASLCGIIVTDNGLLAYS